MGGNWRIAGGEKAPHRCALSPRFTEGEEDFDVRSVTVA